MASPDAHASLAIALCQCWGRRQHTMAETAKRRIRQMVEFILIGMKERHVPLLPVCMQSTPSRVLCSFTCRDLIAASVSIGLRPEFSANAMGIASRASAKARMAYCSRPGLCKIVRFILGLLVMAVGIGPNEENTYFDSGFLHSQ